MEVPPMERPDDPTPERDAAEAAAEKAQHKHPASPQGHDSSFAEGVDEHPDSPDEQLEPDFARGERTGPESDLEHQGRFSEGVEQDPDSPEKTVERRFSEGVEESPTSE
jgi:hypothetical protein